MNIIQTSTEVTLNFSLFKNIAHPSLLSDTSKHALAGFGAYKPSYPRAINSIKMLRILS